MILWNVEQRNSSPRDIWTTHSVLLCTPNPRTSILCKTNTNKVRQVIDVVDKERQENFPLLEKLPDRETRVIGVINKCDTKQKKSHEWVCSCSNVDQNISLMNPRSLILSGMIPNLNIT